MAKGVIPPQLSPEQAQAAYQTIGQLIATMPTLDGNGEYPAETLMWLGRATAQMQALFGFTSDTIAFKSNADHLASFQDAMLRESPAQMIRALLYRAQSYAEMLAPVSAQGMFVNAGNGFDALAAVSKVLSGAKQDVLIVDPYMDEKALTDFAPLATDRIAIRLLADAASNKPSLLPAAQRWVQQYGLSIRPLEVRLAPARQLHDRLIVIDNNEVWVLTQSLNAFAQRSPASIVRVDVETAALKVQAYGVIWSNSTKLV